MIWSLVRTLLVWLLVLAVPLQAVAAATMALCGPGHHGRGAAIVDQASGAHPHHGAMAHHHEHRLAPAEADPAGQPEVADGAAAAQTDDAGSAKCSACASCCSAAAIFDTVAALAAPVVGPAVFPTFAHSVDPFAVSGPDRPPRSDPA